jgi:hypothetical protein
MKLGITLYQKICRILFLTRHDCKVIKKMSSSEGASAAAGKANPKLGVKLPPEDQVRREKN